MCLAFPDEGSLAIRRPSRARDRTDRQQFFIATLLLLIILYYYADPRATCDARLTVDIYTAGRPRDRHNIKSRLHRCNINIWLREYKLYRRGDGLLRWLTIKGTTHELYS